jgi:hypothetical protein
MRFFIRGILGKEKVSHNLVIVADLPSIHARHASTLLKLPLSLDIHRGNLGLDDRSQ